MLKNNMKWNNFKNNLMLYSNEFYNSLTDENLQESVVKLNSLLERIPYTNTLSKCIKNLVEILFIILPESLSDKEERIKYRFLFNSYITGIDNFFNEVIGDDSKLKEDQILDLFITNLDDGSLKSISESFRDICDKDDSKLDVFFYHTILSCIKKYKNLEDTPKLYNKWCLNICEAKKIDFEKRSEYRTYYDKLSPSMFDKRINYYRAFDNHYEIVKKNIYESLYENPKWTFETLYCPVNVTLKGDKDDAVTVNDDEAFNIWNNSCDEGLLIIQGEPGSGKSTITKKITQKLLIDGSLVFYIQLYNLDLTHKTINEDLTYLLKNEYPLFKMMISNHINEEFQEIEELKKAIFIFDGFDEIAGIDEEKKYEHFIREINKIGKMTKVILVGRRYMFDFIMYSSLTCKYYTLSIDNLFEDNAEKILKHYSHLFKSPQMLDIKDLKGIDKEFISNPLLIFLYVYVQSKNRNDDFCKIKNKANLYDLIIRTTYKRDYKIKPCISSIQIKENEINSLSNYTLTLEIIGFVGYINNLREVDVAVCKELAHSIGLVSFDYWLDTTNNQKPYRLLMHFFLKNKKSRLYFFHKTFNEYLGQRFIIDFFINYDKLNDSFRNEIRKLLIKKHNIFNDSDSFFKDIVYSLNRSDYLDLKNNLTELFIEAFNIINKNYFGFDYDKFIFVLNFLSSLLAESIEVPLKYLYMPDELNDIYNNLFFDEINMHIYSEKDMIFNTCIINEANISVFSKNKSLYSRINFSNCEINSSIFLFSINKVKITRDSKFENCIFNCECYTLYLERVIFNNCDFRFIKLKSWVLKNVRFNSCKFPNNMIECIQIENISFVDCKFYDEKIYGFFDLDIDLKNLYYNNNIYGLVDEFSFNNIINKFYDE